MNNEQRQCHRPSAPGIQSPARESLRAVIRNVAPPVHDELAEWQERPKRQALPKEIEGSLLRLPKKELVAAVPLEDRRRQLFEFMHELVDNYIVLQEVFTNESPELLELAAEIHRTYELFHASVAAYADLYNIEQSLKGLMNHPRARAIQMALEQQRLALHNAAGSKKELSLLEDIVQTIADIRSDIIVASTEEAARKREPKEAIASERRRRGREELKRIEQFLSDTLAELSTLLRTNDAADSAAWHSNVKKALRDVRALEGGREQRLSLFWADVIEKLKSEDPVSMTTLQKESLRIAMDELDRYIAEEDATHIDIKTPARVE